ncbi:MAG: hypothetical protein CMO80_11855 [Verrucomicrobiales bacterium]|nr:hypothetical protein [Verrucomicrobiales bacterium]|tara:strand:- start:2235 stop:2465 length:231 start_codon:yes stop_codon:yes gene_type:complete
MAEILSEYTRTNRHAESNDVQDIFHAMTAIPFCDAYFCDRNKANMFRQSPLQFDEIYQTRIGYTAQEILDFLSEIS